MYEKIFRKYIAQVAPEMETERKNKAEQIFINCVKHKEDILVDMDREFLKIEKTLPITIATKFQKTFFKNNSERKIFVLKGEYIENDMSKQMIDKNCFPYVFPKEKVNAELTVNGTLSLETKFLDMLPLLTGEIIYIDDFIYYESYHYKLDNALKKILDNILDTVIDKYTKGILSHPYDQYEDIKDIVNLAVYNIIGYLSLAHFCENSEVFGEYVGWENKTIKDILELAKNRL